MGEGEKRPTVKNPMQVPLGKAVVCELVAHASGKRHKKEKPRMYLLTLLISLLWMAEEQKGHGLQTAVLLWSLSSISHHCCHRQTIDLTLPVILYIPLSFPRSLQKLKQSLSVLSIYANVSKIEKASTELDNKIYTYRKIVE